MGRPRQPPVPKSTINIPKELHKSLKEWVAARSMTVEAAATIAIQQLIYYKPPPKNVDQK